MSSYWLQTLGCPKNDVDGEKLAHALRREGYADAGHPAEADLVVVNSCAFIEAARRESIETVLELAEARRPGARLVVTGCLAERYGEELSAALPEVDLVAGFGQPLEPLRPADQPSVPVALRRGGHRAGRDAELDGRVADGTAGSFDLLELPRGPSGAPWAYVKVAEGCDRRCGFCAIPSFRGAQRSRRPGDVLDEVRFLTRPGRDGAPGIREVVLVAQDLASYGRDRSGGLGWHPRRAAGGSDRQPVVDLVRRVSELVERTRLLYLYPSSLTDGLVEVILASGVPYFDLSLQHVSRPLLAGMRRWGDGERFLDRIERIRRLAPEATFRSSFILGYPGETERDQDRLLEFLEAARLDWAGFFTFSPEAGTHAVGLDHQVPAELALERLRECKDLQDGITESRRRALVGRSLEVLVDRPGEGRSAREAPQIDGVVRVPADLPVGWLGPVSVSGAAGVDLWAEPTGVAS